MAIPDRRTLRLLARQMLRIDHDRDQAWNDSLEDWRAGMPGYEPAPDEYVDWYHQSSLTWRDSIALFEMMEELNLLHGIPAGDSYRVKPTERFFVWLNAVENDTFVDSPPEPEAFAVLDVDQMVERPMLGDGIFIVHGEDTSSGGTLLAKVSHFVREDRGCEPIVLDVGRKNNYLWASFEEEAATCAVAICIWTADRSDPESGFIRPNVTLETGYFIGRLGLDRVIIIRDSGVNHSPSDLAGRTYLTENNWEHYLEARLDAAFGNATQPGK